MTAQVRSGAALIALALALAACAQGDLSSQVAPRLPDTGMVAPPPSAGGEAMGGAIVPPSPQVGGEAAGGSTAPPPPPGPELQPAAARLVRLTRSQYQATLRVLLGADLAIPQDLDPDTPLHGFTTVGGSEITISPRAAEQFEAAALNVAQQVVTDAGRRAAVIGCEVTAGDDACARGFYERFLRRAFRRPVSAEELEAFATLARQTGDTLRDPWQGVGYAVAAALQSPDVLYRVEVGEPDPARPGGWRFTDYEMASRLSYFLWNEPPDDALLTAAERGLLVTSDGLRAEAERLLADPRAESALLAFFGEYINLDRVSGVQRDRSDFPQMSPTLAASMRTELEALFTDVAFTRDAPFAELITSRRVFVNGELAALYGLPFPLDSAPEAFVPVDLPGNSPRGGLLGTAGILSAYAHRTVTSPTLRGKFVQNALLCFDVPPPPPGVSTSLEEDPPGASPSTTREKISRHATDPTCNGCHQFMDPIGLALEHFDAIGAYRTTEFGVPIDASGELAGAEYRGLSGLAGVLRAHPDVGACLVRRMYRFATGHLEEPGEQPAIFSLVAALSDDEFRVRSTALEIVLSPGFRLTAEAAQ